MTVAIFVILTLEHEEQANIQRLVALIEEQKETTP